MASQPNPEWEQHTKRIQAGESGIPWRAVVWLLAAAVVLGVVVTVVELVR